MKILIVSFTFPPNKDGVSEAAAAMALGFIGRGWKVEVLTESINNGRDSDTWNGVAITEYRIIAGKAPEIAMSCGTTSYQDYLTRSNADVVVFQSHGLPLYRALPVLPRMRSIKILVSHGYAPLVWVRFPKFPYGLGFWLRAVTKSFAMPFWLRCFDRSVYLSESADLRAFYDHLIAKLTGYQGRRVIPNGVDREERGMSPMEFRRRHGIEEGAFVFLCVANYSHRKDQGYGARAFRKAAIPGSVLVFIGSEFNEESRRFQKADALLMNDSTPGRIIWLEKQSRKETLDALAGCDVFLLSAYHEAQPIAILEAMREGKPWIARDAGCIASMEGGRCVKSEAAMAAAMRQFNEDKTLRDRLAAEGAAAVATRYNRETYVKSYCDLVEELLPNAT
ncbi:MAG: glycosyltransferase family 4 protein [Luteolibacter sp.]